MFDQNIAHARSMLDRMRISSQLVKRGEPRSPIDDVPAAEISTWYGGVYDAFVLEFGKESKEFKRFWEVREQAQAYLNDWTRTHKQDADEPFIAGYIGYLQIMIAHLLTFADQPPTTKVTLPWLLKNVPATLWAAALGILLSTFILGLQASRIAWVRDLLKLP